VAVVQMIQVKVVSCTRRSSDDFWWYRAGKRKMTGIVAGLEGDISR